MGLALLANLSACDFGYISVGQLIDRTDKAFRTMAGLERHRGHFYNWYDTESLKPLLPMYVSSVDSGNLAASLLTLRAGLLALPDEKLLGARFFDGLGDTLMVLSDAVGTSKPAALARMEKDMESARASRPDSTLMTVKESIDRLAASATEVVRDLSTAPDGDALWWARAFAAQCRAALDELTLWLPWTRLPSTLKDSPGFSNIPTLRQLACLDDIASSLRARERIAVTR